jgi:hypothetical protein
MATTVTAPVSNSIALASKYLPFLDEVYKQDSKSAILDTANQFVNFVGANAVNIFNLSTVGMGDYSRNAGFVPGDATGTWQTYTLSIDRGRSFMIDVMDNDETLGMAFGSALNTIERQSIIPEVDAIRFAAYATGAAAANKATGSLSTGSGVVSAIDTATIALDDGEVPYEGRLLFVSPKVYNLLKAGITRMVMNNDPNVNNYIEMYNDMRVIRVPQTRFYTAITLAQPSAHDGAGGYSANGNGINFMILHPSAVLQVMKHYVPRVFSPEVNQEADAWKINMRYVMGAWVLSHKTNGIYVHSDSTISG